jgi:hypothetical protein
MDEGLTSYQSSWATGMTPQDRAARGGRDTLSRAKGYRGLLKPVSGIDRTQMFLYQLDLIGRAEPIGTRADQFTDFGIYNTMIYDRAEEMYGALRDAVGDSAFVRFMRGYYRDWRFLHVDMRAMRSSAEQASGTSLGWFFDQWVLRTGLVDYALKSVKTTRAADGTWITRGRVVRTGDYRHPMPLGALTSAGWTIVRGNPLEDDQWIEVRTTEKPRAVKLDPLRSTEDWDRRNDTAKRFTLLPPKEERIVRNTIDWPFLDETDRDHVFNAFAPVAWTSTANGFAAGFRIRSGYQNVVDRDELGITRTSRARPVSTIFGANPEEKGLAFTRPVPSLGIPSLAVRFSKPHGNWLPRTPFWWSHENPRLPLRNRPVIGLRFGAWSLDGVAGGELTYGWDASPFYFSKTRTTRRTLQATLMAPERFGFLPARWEDVTTAELRFAETTRLWTKFSPRLSYSLSGGYAGARPNGTPRKNYARGTAALQFVRFRSDSGVAASLRLFGGGSTDATPLQRRVYASSQDPYETFSSNFVRPAGGLLAEPDAHYVPLGGAGIRAFDQRLPVRTVGAANAELGMRLGTLARTPRALTLWASAFGDAGQARMLDRRGLFLADAGVGLSLRGWFYDREVRLRVDAPLVVTNATLGVGEPKADVKESALRWQFSLADLW